MVVFSLNLRKYIRGNGSHSHTYIMGSLPLAHNAQHSLVILNCAMVALCRSPAFSSGVAYAVSCLEQQDIVIKEKESEVIKSIYEGKDVFAWLPTGYGKSLRYQLLLFLFDLQLGRTRAFATERSVALVISPLVSLMVYQVCSLQAHGVCAAILNSGNTWVSKALLATERNIAQGKLRFLFTAPGAILGNRRWKQILLEL